MSNPQLVVRSGVPALLVAVLAPFLALTVVIAGPAEPAAAWAQVPGPVEVDPSKGIKTVPATQVVKRAGRFSPWMRAANMLQTAYGIADAFLPVPGGFEPNTEADSVVTAPSGCGVSFGEPEFSGRGLVVNMTWSGCLNIQSTLLMWTNPRCRMAAGSTPPFINGGIGNMIGPASPAAQGNNVFTVPDICPVGSKLEGIQIEGLARVTRGSTGAQVYGEPYSADEYETTTTVKCRQPDGSLVTITDTLRGYPEVLPVPSCADRVPGSIPWDIKVDGGGWGAPKETLIDIGTDPNILTKYPDCFSGGAMTCAVKVWVGSQPCVRGMAGCTNWYEEETGVCKWGPYTVATSQCLALKESYRRQRNGVITGTKPNGDPEVQYEPDPADLPAPNTTPGTGAGTGQNTFPGSGVNPLNPRTQPNAQTDPDTQSCFSDAWSWNPVDWIYVPVKCAMLWAFKPKTALAVRVTDIKDAVGVKAPFSYVTGLGSLPGLVGGVGGACPDWRIKVGTTDKNVVCDSSYTDAVRAARPVLAGMMILLAVWPIVRSIGYASFPLIKPVPTR